MKRGVHVPVSQFVRGFLRGIGRISFLAPNPLLMYRFRTSAHGIRYDVERVGEDMQAAMMLVFAREETEPDFPEREP